MARNLIMEVGEHAEAVTFLIRDRDTKFTAAFDRMFAHAGLKILRNPVRAPEGERRLLLSRLLDVRPEPA
jgi:putative transposase